MHPDRFQANERLASRASEQFKAITQAKDFLLAEKDRVHSSQAHKARATAESAPTAATELHVKIQAVRAARVAMVSYLDAELDARKNSAIMLIVGMVLGAVARRLPLFAAVGMALIVWGLVGMVKAHMQARSLQSRIDQLKADEKTLQQELEDMR